MVTPESILNAKILIVDDVASNVRLLEVMLKAAGYKNFKSLTDPREIASLFDTFNPDIILLDLQMPYMDGFQVMEQLKKINPADSYLPILVLTAQTDQETRLKALNSGAKDFLGKPLENLEVLSRIRNMLEVRLLHNEIRDQNQVLEEKVRERTKELLASQQEIISRLAHAVERRDFETGQHITRISNFCFSLAKSVGFSDEECALIRQASPLHDIGKIGIPDRILLKPDKLTFNEFEVIKTHTTIGADLLAGGRYPVMQMAQTIALTHHEKWDGSGYPQHLKGEEIPLTGRIISICDVFDALTTERIYKKAWPIQVALTEIKAQKNRHFDPNLVDIFEKIFPEIMEKYREFSDLPKAPQPVN